MLVFRTASSIVILSFIFLVEKAGGLKESTCDPYIGGASATISVSSHDPKYRLLQLSEFPLSASFQTALEVCQKCINATLVTHSSIKNQLLPNLPLYIGATNKDNNSNLHSDKWFWIDDGTQLRPDEIDFSDGFLKLESPLLPNVTYGVLVVTAEMLWRLKDKGLVGGLNPMLIPIPIDQSYWTFMVSGGGDKLAFGDLKSIACQRPYRHNCHHWQYTEDGCFYDGNFGCHTFTNNMFGKGDDNDSLPCQKPQFERVAKQCPISQCTCQVGKWTSWTRCQPRNCTLTSPMKQRSREKTDKNCPDSFLHEPLNETKPCKVVSGCELMKP